MRFGLLVPLLILAGCTAPATVLPESATPPAITAPAAFTLANNASGCFEALSVILVTPAVAQKMLPANWTAADAQGLLGLPIPAGRGVVWVNGYYCSASDIAGGDLHGAEIGVLVEQPKVAGNVSAAEIHVYEFAQVSPIDKVQKSLASVGFPVLEGHAEATFTTTTAGQQGELRVLNESGVLHSFSFTALPAGDLTTTANFWHETPDGIAYFHFEIDNIPVQKGTINSCTLTGVAAQLVGKSTCANGDALALVAPAQAWKSTFNWLPGTHSSA